MSMLNASLIICSPSSKRNKRILKGKSSILQSSRKKKAVSSLNYIYKKSFYDSPLKFIRQSHNIMKSKYKSRNEATLSLQRNIQTIDFTKLQSCGHSDSVIIISDSENDEDKTNQRKSKKADKITTESLCTSPNELLKAIQRLRKTKERFDISKNSPNIKKSQEKRDCVELVDNNTSHNVMSNNKNLECRDPLMSVNRENIEPSQSLLNQTSDDIIMVWSSTENKDQEMQDLNQKQDERIFMIDYHRDLNNLECLQPEKSKEKSKKKKLKSKNKQLPFSTPGLILPACKNIIPSSKISKFKDKQKINNTNKDNVKVNTNEIFTKYSTGTLREIVIDGCNVAMAHSNNKTFSEVGLKLVVDYFKERGHTVKVFVPQHKRSYNHPLLEKLHLDGTVIFTPSRYIAGKSITPYDDRYILKYATMCKGIVVSLDQYRDLYSEKPEWRETIEKRLLAPTFVGDYVMFPEDPLGRDGPTLDEFLRH